MMTSFQYSPKCAMHAIAMWAGHGYRVHGLGTARAAGRMRFGGQTFPSTELVILSCTRNHNERKVMIGSNYIRTESSYWTSDITKGIKNKSLRVSCDFVTKLYILMIYCVAVGFDRGQHC